jgi:hypothetical protein
MATLYELTNPHVFNKVVESIKTNTVTLPAEFYTVTDTVSGDTASWLSSEGVNHPGQFSAYDSKTIPTADGNATPMSAKMLYMGHSTSLQGKDLLNALKPNSTAPGMSGDAIVARYLSRLKSKLVNGETGAAAALLSQGKIYLDGSGNLTNDPTAAKRTVDFGVDDAQYAYDYDSSSSGSILATLDEMIQDIFDETNYQMGEDGGGYLFYGRNVKNRVMADTDTMSLITGNNELARAFFSSSRIPSGIRGLNCVYGGNIVSRDSNNNVIQWFGDDQIVICPPLSAGWWGYAVGSQPFTTDAGVSEGETLDGIEERFGMNGWTQRFVNPSRFEFNLRNTWLCEFLVPGVVRSANWYGGS